MSFTDSQDLLIFVGIPLAVVAIVFALVYASGTRGAKRYRPGRSYHFAPVWYLSKPESDGPAAISGHSTSSGHAALEAAPSNVSSNGSSTGPSVGREHLGETGGASDRW